MKRFLMATALIALTQPASALDLKTMSDEERQIFREEVRAYLLDNPEVIMEAVAVLEQRQAQDQVSADMNLVAANADAIFDDGYSWIGGNPEGDFTMVEFVDYRCGYCRRAHDEVKELVQADGNIRLIVKEFPILGEDSEASARFAIAVKNTLGAEAYAKVNDALIRLNTGINEVALRRLSATLGFDAEPLLAMMDDASVTAEIQQTRLLAQRLQITGTPTFVMQDEMMRGYAPLDTMQQIVAQKRG
ncbi:DsbA family protein [Cognatishimia sp. SS12]|uniref:DsbA family protein n=1 Tax=Cognatishimia sp. SS12 TaxID=2979465 RepID=UPI00232BC6BB|nr:DsbA family protein [Cognatishimia sp. SS12]MDC0737208.1 DsbA family protein [Cognatishimia sp. SS12]